MLNVQNRKVETPGPVFDVGCYGHFVAIVSFLHSFNNYSISSFSRRHSHGDRFSKDSMEEKLDSTDSPSSRDIVVASTYIKPQGRKTHDPDVRFEEYFYYAQRTREEEKTLESPQLNWREILLRKKNEHDVRNSNGAHQHHLAEKDFANRTNRLEISDEEWTNASRAFRTASWGACKWTMRVDHRCL